MENSNAMTFDLTRFQFTKKQLIWKFNQKIYLENTNLHKKFSKSYEHCENPLNHFIPLFSF